MLGYAESWKHDSLPGRAWERRKSSLVKLYFDFGTGGRGPLGGGPGQGGNCDEEVVMEGMMLVEDLTCK